MGGPVRRDVRKGWPPITKPESIFVPAGDEGLDLSMVWTDQSDPACRSPQSLRICGDRIPPEGQ